MLLYVCICVKNFLLAQLSQCLHMSLYKFVSVTTHMFLYVLICESEVYHSKISEFTSF